MTTTHTARAASKDALTLLGLLLVPVLAAKVLSQVGAYNGSMHSSHPLWNPGCSGATANWSWSTCT